MEHLLRRQLLYPAELPDHIFGTGKNMPSSHQKCNSA